MQRLWDFLKHRHGLKDLNRYSSTDLQLHRTDDENIADAIVEIKIECLSRDFHHNTVLNPFVCVHLCDAETGQYLSKHLNIDNEAHPTSARGKGTFPYCFGYVAKAKEVRFDHSSQEEKSNENHVSFVWDESIIINGNYKHVLDGSSLFLFELLDMRSDEIKQGDMHGKEEVTRDKVDRYHHTAWGFLKPFGKDGRCNVGTDTQGNNLKRCRIQLYRYQHNSMFVRRQARQMNLCSKTVPKVFLQYLRWSNVPIVPTLHIQVGPSIPSILDISNKQKMVNNITRSEDNQGQMQKKMTNEASENLRLVAEIESKKSQEAFVRQPHENCEIPDNLYRRIHKTCAVRLKFNHTGSWLAMATRSYSILIYEVYEGGDNVYLSCFHDDEVTSLAWSYDNLHLCSASMDGTIAVHEVGTLTYGKVNNNTMIRNVPKVIFTVTPSFLSSIAFIPMKNVEEHVDFSETSSMNNIPSFLVSANEKSLKIWNTNEGVMKGEIGGTIDHHLVQITALSKEDSSGRIFSGDASGCIIVWKPEATMTLDTLHSCNYTILRRILYLQDSTLNRGIESLHFQTSIASAKKTLLVTTTERKGTQNNIFFMIFLLKR